MMLVINNMMVIMDDLSRLNTRGKIIAVKKEYSFLSAIGVAKRLKISVRTVRSYWPKLVKADEKAAGVVK